MVHNCGVACEELVISIGLLDSLLMPRLANMSVEDSPINSHIVWCPTTGVAALELPDISHPSIQYLAKRNSETTMSISSAQPHPPTIAWRDSTGAIPSHNLHHYPAGRYSETTMSSLWRRICGPLLLIITSVPARP